jgi:hypothetical protein
MMADPSGAPRAVSNAARGAPNAHRVHSSCDRCRSRKTKVRKRISVTIDAKTLSEIVVH